MWMQNIWCNNECDKSGSKGLFRFSHFTFRSFPELIQTHSGCVWDWIYLAASWQFQQYNPFFLVVMCLVLVDNWLCISEPRCVSRLFEQNPLWAQRWYFFFLHNMSLCFFHIFMCLRTLLAALSLIIETHLFFYIRFCVTKVASEVMYQICWWDFTARVCVIKLVHFFLIYNNAIFLGVKWFYPPSQSTCSCTTWGLKHRSAM